VLLSMRTEEPRAACPAGLLRRARARACRQPLQRLAHGARRPGRAVQPGHPGQPPGPVPGADHVQAAPARGGSPGRAGQHLRVRPRR
jgi:hypothetical protein